MWINISSHPEPVDRRVYEHQGPGKVRNETETSHPQKKKEKKKRKRRTPTQKKARLLGNDHHIAHEKARLLGDSSPRPRYYLIFTTNLFNQSLNGPSIQFPTAHMLGTVFLVLAPSPFFRLILCE